MELKLVKINEVPPKLLDRIDKFILSENTNGEFINSLKYLSYHPNGRFQKDSVVVLDEGSKEIQAVMFVTVNSKDALHIVSHMGTTFAGPILNSKVGIKQNIEIMDLILEYYEEKYNRIEIRVRPSVYDDQPMDFISYYLLQKGYSVGMMALANVIKLSSISDIEAQLKLYDSKRRNHIKKALKEERYIVKKEVNINEAAWNNMEYNLCEKFGSHTTHSYEEIQKLITLCPENILPRYTERYDGNYGAFALVYKFKNVYHTQYLDVNYALSAEYPHLFLIHNLIKEAREQGFSYFSFGASTEERGEYLNEGLYNYKNGYGGGSVILPVYTKVLSK